MKIRNLEKLEKKSTRQAYGDAMVEIGKDKRVYGLTADLKGSVKLGDFEKKYPNQFVECGIAEANMVGVAAGLALTGKIPFASTFAVFCPGRSYDHLRQSVCYNNANVKIASTHAGLTVGEDGATHQMLEDIALMRVLPNMKVIVPCDYEETKKAIKLAYKLKGPVYIRLGRPNVPMLTNKKSEFKFGKINVLKPGKDVVIISCGNMIYESLIAALKLEKEGISVSVINCHTIKPLDESGLLKAVKNKKLIITCEEHSKIGGLGSAIAEFFSDKVKIPLKIIGVNDTFGESGTSSQLLEKYGLTSSNIIKEIKKRI